MPVFRVKKDKDNPYVLVNKCFIYDKKISFKAKGILMYCLSRPDNWQFYEEEISNNSVEGISSVKSGLKELRDKGYIVRKRKRDTSGKFKGYEYFIYEIPKKVISDGEEEFHKECNVTSKKLNSKENNKVLRNKDEEKMLLNKECYTEKFYKNEDENNLNNYDCGIKEEKNNISEEKYKITDKAINLLKYVEKITGTVGIINLSAIKIALIRHGYKYTKMAIEKSIEVNKCDMRYINGILRIWAKEGYPKETIKGGDKCGQDKNNTRKVQDDGFGFKV